MKFYTILAPSYISSQSANVILSDVRPFKLQSEALHAINVFLDEFLYSILDKSSSLSTDKLRASLLNLLPTSLGKEALLEAEVELRAYWDRTTGEDEPAPACEDDSTTFYLEWVFEVSVAHGRGFSLYAKLATVSSFASSVRHTQHSMNSMKTPTWKFVFSSDSSSTS